MTTTIDAMKQASDLFHKIYQQDDQHACDARKGEEILTSAIAREEAQNIEAAPCEVCAMRSVEAMSEIEEAQPVEPPNKSGKCIDAFGNSLIGIGDEVENDDARFFVGSISDGGLCSIDKSKPYAAKNSGLMSRCIAQGNYAAKASVLTFTHPTPPQSGEQDAIEGLRTWAGITEREALLQDINKWIGWTNTVGYPDLGRVLGKSADMLAADAQEMDRLRGVAREAADAATLLQKSLLQAQQVAVPKGFKLVPIEPTLEIKQAMHKAKDRQSHYKGDISRDSWFDQPERMYHAAMLAAAPQPPQAEQVPMPESGVPGGKTLIDTDTFCMLLEMALKYKELSKSKNPATPNTRGAT